MPTLYPLKFKPDCRETVWGGTRLSKLGKAFPPSSNCGESWEIGAFKLFDSEVASGFLEGNTLSEIIEVYMAELVGDSVFEKFGHTFPLLIKFIDTNDVLSVQVHPNDKIALSQNGQLGKTEAWYVVDAHPGAKISLGFNKDLSREELINHIENNTLHDVLQTKEVSKGDFFFLPAGTVHAIGKGITLCEIQQASDVTFRLFDWNRPGLDGKPRELHLDQALDAVDYSRALNFNKHYNTKATGSVELLKCDEFTVNLLNLEKTYESDYVNLDSFVVLICIEGEVLIDYNDGVEPLSLGQVLLLPAELKQLKFKAVKPSKIIEVYLT